MIKAILYDCDGVLVDMADCHYRALNSALKEVCNYEIPYDVHMRYYNGLPTNDKTELLIRRGIISNKEERDKVWRKKQEYTFEFIKLLNVDKVKIELHEELRQTYRLACVSNSIRATLTEMLRTTGQLDFMTFILGNEDFGNKPKPNPDPYLLAFQKMNLQPQECLIVEDSPKGMLAAQRSKAHVVETIFEKVNLENIKKAIGIANKGEMIISI